MCPSSRHLRWEGRKGAVCGAKRRPGDGTVMVSRLIGHDFVPSADWCHHCVRMVKERLAWATRQADPPDPGAPSTPPHE